MGERLAIRNPRSGVVDHHVTGPDPDEIIGLAGRLRDGHASWLGLGLAGRVAAMRQWAEALRRQRDAVAAALVHDTGRRSETDLEIEGLLATVARWCGRVPELLADEPERATSAPGIRLRQAWEPYPLVGVIGPWNFPLLLSHLDAVPALLAGCSVLVKPSELTPRFVEPLRETVAAVPALSAALAHVVGGPAAGAAVVGTVDAVCFTGSIATGRRVAAAAAERLIPAHLELGGKDPAVVLEGADLDLATAAILWGGTANAGQSCQSIERVYAADAVYRPFVDRLVARAEAVPLAYPEPDSGVIGPIIAARQVEVIAGHLEDAYARGAIAACGGKLETLGGGTYLRPTVLTGVDHSMKVMTEETFGPVLPVMAVPSVDDAVALANGTVYGLSAAVFGPEPEALEVAARIEAGAVSVNDAALTAVVHDGEKNAFGHSGLGGTRMGSGAVRRFLRRRAYLVKQGSEPDPWWYR